MRKRRANPRLLGLAGFVFTLIFMCGMFVVAFLLTASIYKVFALNPPMLLVQVINSLLGLLLTGLVFGSLSKVARSKGWIPEVQVLGPIIEALDKIAKGDFSTRVNNHYRDNQIVTELAESVNKMVLNLDQMENMRQEFVSNVSHEIQSPLTSIRGFAQALKNEQLTTEERRHYLDIIEMESTRLSGLADDLLKLASLDANQVQFESGLVRLDKQIRSLVLTCEPQWRDKQIEWDVSLDEAVIWGDEALLSQLWLNLIHNSIKFTSPGGSISLTLCSQGEWIRFQISDTGIGISSEDQVHIFERFYKADRSRTYARGGSGLGLSIVKKIVEMHKGTIEVESQPGAGTTFIVSLPI